MAFRGLGAFPFVSQDGTSNSRERQRRRCSPECCSFPRQQENCDSLTLSGCSPLSCSEDGRPLALHCSSINSPPSTIALAPPPPSLGPADARVPLAFCPGFPSRQRKPVTDDYVRKLSCSRGRPRERGDAEGDHADQGGQWSSYEGGVGEEGHTKKLTSSVSCISDLERFPLFVILSAKGKHLVIDIVYHCARACSSVSQHAWVPP